MPDPITIKVWMTKKDKPASYLNTRICMNAQLSPEALKVHMVLFHKAKDGDIKGSTLVTLSTLSPDKWKQGIADLVKSGVLLIHGSNYYLGSGTSDHKAAAVAMSYGITTDELNEALNSRYTE